MKKVLKIAVALLLVLLIAAGGFLLGRKTAVREGETPYATAVMSGKTFYATVDDIRGGGMKVIGLEENDINHRGAFSFSLKDSALVWRYTEISINDLQVGDVVAVTYNGSVQESDPAGLTSVTKVELLSDREEGWALAAQCKVGDSLYTYQGEMVEELPEGTAELGSVPQDYEGNCEGTLYGEPGDVLYFRWAHLSEYAWKHPYLVLQKETASE